MMLASFITVGGFLFGIILGFFIVKMMKKKLKDFLRKRSKSNG